MTSIRPKKIKGGEPETGVMIPSRASCGVMLMLFSYAAFASNNSGGGNAGSASTATA